MRSSCLYGVLVAAVVATSTVSTARAEVTRIEVTSKHSFGVFRAGDFTRIDMRIVGELAPSREKVADLDKAPRNSGLYNSSTP